MLETTASAPTRAVPKAPRGALYLPAEKLPALIRAAGTRKQNGGADVVAVLDRSHVHVMESGLAHVTRRQVYKALSDRGGSLLAVRRFDYDPATNVIRLLRIRVHRPGKPPQDFPASRARDLPQPAGWIFWKTRMKVLGIPRLEVGEALEVITYTKGFQIAYLGDDAKGDDARYVPPMRGHFYDTVLFADDPFPVRYKSYRITTPRSKPLRFKVYNGAVQSAVTFTPRRFVYDFTRRNIPRFKRERGSPAASDSVPKVVLATLAGWPAKSRWFYRVNEGQFAANQAIREKVAEVLRGKRTRRERVTALLRWVAANIRYRGLSMGKGEGYTLHPGTRVFAHRAGVCKDIASMLLTMLRAAGFTAYPAMTMAGSRVEAVPADQFNHCVVALKKKQGGYQMLDPTWAPFSRQLWSNAERRQHYLIGTPRGEQLQKIPGQAAGANQLNIRADTRLVGNTSGVEVKLQIWGTGYPDTRLRRQLGSAYAPSEVRHYFERIAGEISRFATVKDYAFGRFAELSRELGMRLTVRAPAYLQRSEALIRVRPATWSALSKALGTADFLTATKTGKRSQPVQLRSTQQVTFQERLQLPAGFRLAKPFQPVAVSHPNASLLVTVQQQGRVLRIDTQLALGSRVFPPGQYVRLKKVVDALRGLWKRSLVLVRARSKP